MKRDPKTLETGRRYILAVSADVLGNYLSHAGVGPEGFHGWVPVQLPTASQQGQAGARFSGWSDSPRAAVMTGQTHMGSPFSILDWWGPGGVPLQLSGADVGSADPVPPTLEEARSAERVAAVDRTLSQMGTTADDVIDGARKVAAAGISLLKFAAVGAGLALAAFLVVKSQRRSTRETT